MEELKRAVADVKAMEVSMLGTLGKLESAEKANSIKNAENFYILSKFTLITSFLVGVMLLHLALFAGWSFFVANQNNETKMAIASHDTISDKSRSDIEAKLLVLDTNQKALIDSTAETNYTIHSNNDETLQQIVLIVGSNKKILEHIQEITTYNKNILNKLQAFNKGKSLGK